MKLEYKITEDNSYLNVKEVLKAYFKISDRLLLRLKNTQNILLNNTPTYVSKKVFTNDIVTVIIDFIEDSENIVPTKMDIDIIYEDDCYIIINKSPNMPVHPSMQHYTNSLSNGLKYYFDSIQLKRKIRPVNRLDKDTSGLVIFAKNEYVQECLVSQMKSKNFEKEYIAICHGSFEKKRGTICKPIARKEGSIIEREVSSDGDTAITHYEVLQEKALSDGSKLSLVKCMLETGRTHQIRVHLSSIGHPILGDTLYGSDSSKISRQLLHAKRIKFNHPITKQNVEYMAPIPEDFDEFIR